MPVTHLRESLPQAQQTPAWAEGARDNAHGQAAWLQEDRYNLMLVAVISQLRGQKRSP